MGEKDSNAYNEKALVFDKLGERHQALENVHIALKIKPGDPDAFILNSTLTEKKVK